MFLSTFPTGFFMFFSLKSKLLFPSRRETIFDDSTQLSSALTPHAIDDFHFGYDKHALHLSIAEKPSLMTALSCHLRATASLKRSTSGRLILQELYYCLYTLNSKLIHSSLLIFNFSLFSFNF